MLVCVVNLCKSSTIMLNQKVYTAVFSLKWGSGERCRTENLCDKINNFGASLVTMVCVNMLRERLACKLI